MNRQKSRAFNLYSNNEDGIVKQGKTGESSKTGLIFNHKFSKEKDIAN